jgi:two-component sensor histidine kinase
MILFLDKLFIHKNYKEMMTGYIYLGIIFILILSMLINFIRGFDDRIIVNSITLFLFSVTFYFFSKSKHPLRAEIYMVFMTVVSEILLATLMIQENFLNYTTVFPMLTTFAIWYFFSLKQALWITLFHFIFWILIYIYGYSHFNNHPILNNATAMMGLAISYLFMSLFGFSYYLSTSKYQQKLEKSNKQQELLLKEIHHRVKNNLNIVSSILGIQQLSENDTHIIDLLKKNRLRIDSIAMVHEILYKYEDFSEINLYTYLSQLMQAIKEMYLDTVKINITNNNISLPLDTVLKLGIITNELAINSIKYAFTKNNGLIDIDFFIKDDLFTFTYSDNGICNKQHKNDIWNSANLGLKLIKMMAKQINADIVLLDTQGLTYQIKVRV